LAIRGDHDKYYDRFYNSVILVRIFLNREYISISTFLPNKVNAVIDVGANMNEYRLDGKDKVITIEASSNII